MLGTYSHSQSLENEDCIEEEKQSLLPLPCAKPQLMGFDVLAAMVIKI